MLMWLTISFRNIIKNGRRSLMTILAIGLGFGAINLFQGYVHSTYQGLTAAAIHGEGLGHLTIFKKGYLDQGKLHPEKFQFSRGEMEKIISLVRNDPGVQLVTPRLSVSGILSNGRNSTIFIGQGLVPDDDAVIRGNIRKFSGFQGTYLSADEPAGVVVGSELAAMLDLRLGSNAVILSNSYSGMANALDVKVRGIYNTGASATNDKMVLMTLPACPRPGRLSGRGAPGRAAEERQQRRLRRSSRTRSGAQTRGNGYQRSRSGPGRSCPSFTTR